MIHLQLHLLLESDATFGGGNSVGLIDQEIALDEFGCPYLHGRTLKGLLGEGCADLLFALENSESTALQEQSDRWATAADALFGRPGSDLNSQGVLHVGHAQLPSSVRRAVEQAVANGPWQRDEIIEALSASRQQTGMNVDGSPDERSLRIARVLLRGTPLLADLLIDTLSSDEEALLAAITQTLRRAGTSRNRGRGRLAATLTKKDGQPTDDWFERFAQEVCP